MHKLALTWTLLWGLAGCTGAGDPEVAVGDDMPALRWEGYINDSAEGLASERPFRDYSTADLQDTGKRYALVHLSESY